MKLSVSFFHTLRDVQKTRLIGFIRDQKQAILDLIILFFLSVITGLILYTLNFSEIVYTYTREHEAYNLDELIVVALVISAVYFPLFALRRWQEATIRLKQANTDGLTGTYNHTKGIEILELEMSRARRYHLPLSIMIFDIDYFKDINDRHGHLVGDQILKVLSNKIKDQMRKPDTLVRWGGEEFLIISSETDLPGARQFAERLRLSIEDLRFFNSLFITASFGIAQMELDDSVDSLFKRADNNLYQAKTDGRNRVV